MNMFMDGNYSANFKEKTWQGFIEKPALIKNPKSVVNL